MTFFEFDAYKNLKERNNHHSNSYVPKNFFLCSKKHLNVLHISHYAFTRKKVLKHWNSLYKSNLLNEV